MSEELAARMQRKIQGSKIEPFVDTLRVEGEQLVAIATSSYIELDEERQRIFQKLLTKVWREESGFEKGVLSVQKPPSEPPDSRATSPEAPSPPKIEIQTRDKRFKPTPRVQAEELKIALDTQSPQKPRQSSPFPAVATAGAKAKGKVDKAVSDKSIPNEAVPDEVAPNKVTPEKTHVDKTVGGSGLETYSAERKAANLVAKLGRMIQLYIKIVTVIIGLIVIFPYLFALFVAVRSENLQAIFSMLVTGVIAVAGIALFWFIWTAVGAVYIVIGGIMNALADISDTLRRDAEARHPITVRQASETVAPTDQSPYRPPAAD